MSVESFFVGTFRHSIDEKGRTSIPAKFRQILETADEFKRAFLFPLNGRIGVYPIALLARINESFGDGQFIQEASIKQMRQTASKFEEVKFDKQGRILIPEGLRIKATLEDEIVFVGCFKMFEIWSYNNWVASEQGEVSDG